MDEKEIVALLRRVRHDFGNHLQVIMGYIDLGDPLTARKFLVRIIEDMEAERQIFASTDASMALYLYQQSMKATDLGVVLRFDVIELNAGQLLMKNNEPYNSLAGICGRLEKTADEDPIIYIEIYETDAGIDLIYSSDYLPEGSVMVNVRE